jgi:predicted nucleotidyltransferase
MAGMAGLDEAALRAFRTAVRANLARELERERHEVEARRSRVRAALAVGLGQARDEGLLGRAWLFGSYAWGDPGVRSDVDLLVDGCDDPTMVAVVVGRATDTDVHVVTIEEAPPSLVERAKSEGIEL